MSEQPAIRWSRVFGVLLIGFVVFELGIQGFMYQWAGKPFDTLSKYKWSPYGLVRNNPQMTHPDYAINENGFRDLRDYTQAKPANTLRVIILGGSTMYSGIGGVYLPDVERVGSDATVSQFLEAAIKSDSRFEGINVEVINASINFNRIPEVHGGYSAEYAYWDPDLVIVGGSANNFRDYMPEGSYKRRDWGILTVHPWRREFDRIANDRGVASLGERALLTLEDDLASVALTRKFFSRGMDVAFAKSNQVSRKLGFAPPKIEANFTLPPASMDEYDKYINEYLGYVDSMIAIAKRHDQAIAFFWEHYLNHVDTLKPLSEDEKKLFVLNARYCHRLNPEYVNYAREAVDQHLAATQDARFLDPIEPLKTCEESVFIDYLHYTKEGNRFMAEFMFDQMQDVLAARAMKIRENDAAGLQMAQQTENAKQEATKQR